MLQAIWLSPVFRFIRRGQLALALAIYIYALLANDIETAGPSLPDWLLHSVGNLLLFGSFWVALAPRWPLLKILWLTIPVAVVFELAQWFSPNRQVDPLDLLANAVGLAFGLVICALAERMIFDRKHWEKDGSYTSP